MPIRTHARVAARLPDIPVNIRPADFVANFFNMPSRGELKRFDFSGRRYLRDIYNTDAQRLLLQCGRQVEKSTTLGNMVLTYACLRRYFRSLCVTPTEIQTSTFSKDKLQEPLNLSPELALFAVHPSSVMEKNFYTPANIKLRYAFLHADRVRGISADMLVLDELQDILTDVIPVIEEALSHSEYKILRYSGTPKSLDNTIAYYWERWSTQNEWAIPCDSCGGGDYRYWNIPGEDNIGPEFLWCSRCKKPINPDHDQAMWVSGFPSRVGDPTSFEGFRIPQLITSWVDWAEILDKKRRYSRRQFYNEVLGLGYDSGDKPLTLSDVRAICGPQPLNNPPISRSSRYYMGIDWGTGENTYTVVTIGRYVGDRFEVVYMKRLEAEDAEPDRQIEICLELVRRFNVVRVGVDYGGGFYMNNKLTTALGVAKVVQFQYGNLSDKIRYNSGLNRFIVNRTAVLMDFMTALKIPGNFMLPRFEDIETPFASDMIAMFSEYNESRKMIVLNKTPGSTDDTLHALTYCFLSSVIDRPRPDIFTPGIEA